MRAHLARHVCRRTLVHSSRSPLSRAPRPRPTYRPHICSSLPIARQSRRTFFGIFQKPPRQIKTPEIEPGWPLVLAWRSRILENLRPPPREELANAFRELFQYKLLYRAPVNSTQALQCFRLFKYLVENKGEEEGPGLSLAELTAAREALLVVPRDNTKHHLEFSQALYTEIQRQRQLDEEFGYRDDDQPADPEAARKAEDEDFKYYLTALTYYGASTDAASALNEYWGKLSAKSRNFKGAKKLWILVLQGLSREGKEAELLRQAEAAEHLGVQYRPHFQEVMTTFFAKQDRVAETKHWFEKDTGKRWPTAVTYAEIIRFAKRNGLDDWVNEAFRSLIDYNPRKPHWDVILQWAVLCRGEGVEGVKHMLDIMTRNNPDDEALRPDIDTINGLIRIAIEKNDQYLAERFMVLASELSIQPDATTYVLQMDYRIDAKDLSGARAAYQEMQRTEVQHDEDLAVINKYIRALCSAPRPLLSSIHEIMGDLEHRIVTLDPETVVALCMTFLKNDDQYDVIDTLAVHVFHYSSEQRAQIRAAFVGFVLDRSNSTARVWDAYQLLRQFFPETDRTHRAALMGAFFDRRRPDMATSVLTHMKEHANRDLHPTVDDYVAVLEGLGRSPDDESLATVHNLVKLDTTVQPCTRLYNALMLAFGACDEPRRALDFWGEVARSPEGPSYASLEIIFAVLEKKPFGDEDARAIWRNMERMELEVPPAVFASYCGALAASGALAEVKGLIKGMERSVGYGPDYMTLGIVHNALPDPKLQAELGVWALSQHPELWSQLEKKGRRRVDERTVFKITRNLKA